MTAKHMAVDAIIDSLNKGDEVIRCSSAKALGLIGDRRAVASLTEHVMDPDVDVSMDSIESLGFIGDHDPVQLLIEGLNQADEGDIRINAADAIGRMGGEGAVEALIEALTMDIDSLDDDSWDASWDINMMAVDGLGRIGDERAVEPLCTMLDDENAIDDEARITSSICLCGEKGINAVISRLKEHENARSRRRCALALGDVDADVARDALTDALLDEDSDVRLYAAQALAKSNDQAYLLPLLMLLKDQHAEVRAEAIALAAQLGGARAAEKIRALLSDDSNEVRKTACRVLGELKDVASVESLLDRLNDPIEEVRAVTIEALGLIADASAREPLLKILADQKEEELLRAAVPAALLNMADTTVLDAFRAAVGDDRQAVRGTAMMALKELDTEETREILLAALRGELLAEAVMQPPVRVADDEQNELAAEGANDEETDEETDGESAEGEEMLINDVYAGEPVFDDDAEPEENQDDDDWTGSTLDVIHSDGLRAESHALNLNNSDFQLSEELQPYVEMAERSRADVEREKKKGKQVAIAPHQDVRMFAARALAGCNHELVREALVVCLDENEATDLRKDVVRSLGGLGDSQAVESLLPLLSDENRDMRFEVIRALGKLGSDAARDAILQKVEDEDFFIRLAVIEAVAGFAGDEAVDALTARLSLEKEPRLKLACAKALAEIGDARAISAVVDAVFIDDGDQRVEVGMLLRNFEPETATDELVAVLGDENQVDKHRAAVEALQEIHRIAA